MSDAFVRGIVRIFHAGAEPLTANIVSGKKPLFFYFFIDKYIIHKLL